MNIISRQDALAQGLARYFTGKPCKRGHVDERHTLNRMCIACDRAAKAAYYENNADDRRAYQNAYYAKLRRT